MTELSNYKYIKTIGEGTFGKVKLAIHILTGEKVAIKILQKNLIKGQKQQERIQNEIKFLKLFNHPNIIKIYEVIENESAFYIVLEYATGGELFNYIVLKEKLSEKETSLYFYQIIQGIKTIHEKKICHRDMKPENILIANNNVIKIIDFGLSSEYNDYLSTPCGSPCYASPEMIKGKNYNGLLIDLWACGIILFAMLFGYLPFDDKNNNILFQKILDGKIDYPEKEDIKVNESGIDLINKILDVDPEKRIGIDEVIKHPFLEYGKNEYDSIIGNDNFVKDDYIINYMETELGFDNKDMIIQNNIYNNRHNHITTTFFLLKQKYLDGRLSFTFRERLYKKIKTSRNGVNDKRQTNFDNSNSNFNSNNYQINKTNYFSQSNNNNNKKSKRASRSGSNKKIISLKDLFNQKNISTNKNNIIIINNTNMIHEPEKLKSFYNSIILKKYSEKNIFAKLGTSVSQEKKVLDKRNSVYIKNAYSYRANNKKNSKIKVCLKKEDKKNKFIYIKKINGNDSCLNTKFIKLPLNNFSLRTYRDNNDFLSYKKNAAGIETVKRYINNIHSFDGNPANNTNFTYSLSNRNLNASNGNEINNLINSDIRYDKIEDKNKKIFINQKLLSNGLFLKKYKNKILDKKRKEYFDKKIDMQNEEDMLNYRFNKNKNKIIKKENYSKNIEKICKKFFGQNKKGLNNFINNNKCNDKKISHDKNKGQNINNNTELIINLNLNNSNNNKILYQNSSRNMNNKNMYNNFMTKNINYYFAPMNMKQRYTLNKKINNIKDTSRKTSNLMNCKMQKHKKIKSLKKILSPENFNNITYENFNINAFKKINTNNKINNIKKILSPNEKMKKPKNNKNLYNILLTDKNISKNKYNGFNYIPITSRESNANCSRNMNANESSNIFQSNTVFIDLNQKMKNDLISTERLKNQDKNTNISTKKSNNVYTKNYLTHQKNNFNDKFLVANTEMKLHQIFNKIDNFCKENNLRQKKDNIYSIKIYDQYLKNCFDVEIAHSSPMNIVKIKHGKNTGNKLKNIITKLFIDIINFE